MNGWLARAADYLRQSYWFIPSIMAMVAVLLALFMIYVDSVGSDRLSGLAWLYAARPDGARQLLSAIGGSMITVAGTVFSVTIAAVVYASGQYGPRLLTNFMSDRGNQVTLGTFIATFLYSLVVLRTVRTAGESGEGADAFVPQFAVLGALVLVLCSIGVLIYFIHHVPQRIHINSVIERIGDKLLDDIDDRFPRRIGQPADEAKTDPALVEDALWNDAAPVRARSTGYLQYINEETLLATAREYDVRVRLCCQPGDFTHSGRNLALVRSEGDCPDDALEALCDAFVVGSRRSALQDMRFLIDELVEIAARALSPGVNDPFTAISCLDWLGAAIEEVAGRELPVPVRAGEDGVPCVVALPVEFEGFLRRSFGALSQYAAADKIAAMAFLTTLGEVANGCRTAGRVRQIRRLVDAFVELAAENLAGDNLAAVRGRAASLIARARELEIRQVETGFAD